MFIAIIGANSAIGSKLPLPFATEDDKFFLSDRCVFTDTLWPVCRCVTKEVLVLPLVFIVGYC